MKKIILESLILLLVMGFLTGCQGKKVSPGDVEGYDEGETYLSLWVHTIEDTPEGEAYKKSVEGFNEAYD